MDTAQNNQIPVEFQQEGPPPVITHVSTFHKYFPFLITGIVLLILLSGGTLLFFSTKSRKQPGVSVTPTIRPTATPNVSRVPTVIPTDDSQPATPSATITPTAVQIGRLAFIRDGSIYHSDLIKENMLLTPKEKALDHLTWSPIGSFLGWRIKSDIQATSSAVSLYNLKKNTTFTIRLKQENSINMLLDFSFSPDESQIALLHKDAQYKLVTFSTATVSSVPIATLIGRSTPITKLFWIDTNKLLFLGIDGISEIDSANTSVRYLIQNDKIQSVSISPDKTTILYSIGDEKKSELYTAKSDGTGVSRLQEIPTSIDFGSSGLTQEKLQQGFIPYAVWYPSSTKLLVGYKYIKDLPIVGEYDLVAKSLKIKGPFQLAENDVIITDVGLLGERINKTLSTTPVSQVSLFTLSQSGNLGLVRVFSNSSSPAIFTGTL